MSHMNSVLVIILGVISWQGCGDEDFESLNLEAKNSIVEQRQSSSSPAFHRYQGNYEPTASDVSLYMRQMQSRGTVVSSQLVIPPQPPLPFGGAGLPQVDPRRLDSLQVSAGRISEKREDLKRVLSELDMEQRQYQTDLQTVNSEYERNRQVIMDEYSRYIQSLRSMAALQVSYPRDQVYVNAYQGATSVSTSVTPLDIAPFVAPVVAESVVSSSALPADYTRYTASLLSFIENCLSLCAASSTGATIARRLESIKSDVLASRSTHSVASLAESATQANALLTDISKLPRRSSTTISEVWVDPQSVSGREDQLKLDQLVLQEAKSRVALAAFASDDKGEFKSSTTIPDLFSLTQNQDSRHHKIKIFRDRKSQQIKLIATCFYKRFINHQGERYFLSFTCEDTQSSFGALADTGSRNFLSESVLKVVCHSKEFAKKLVLDAASRAHRCNLSKWTLLVEGVSDGKFARTDRQGKLAWRALKQGTGCFSKDESEISANCKNGKLKRWSKKSSTKKNSHNE